MATALGYRLLVRYYEGTATLAQLDAAKTKGWINQVEYDQALAGDPPEGYAPPGALVADAPTDTVTSPPST